MKNNNLDAGVALGMLATLALLASCGGGSGSGTSSPPSSTNPPAVTSTLSGSVLDTHGAAIAGATVTVYHTNDHTSP